MSIQRQMGTVNGKIVVEQRAHELVALLCPRMCLSPKQSVVYQEQISLDTRCQSHGGQARIDGGGNSRYCAAIFYLETVGGAVIVLHLGDVQLLIAETNNIGQDGFP